MLSTVDLCRLLADPTRLGVITLLAEGDEACVCDLIDCLETPQSTMSRHLGQLRQAGLVVARREGTWMHYRINPALPAWARETIETLAEPAREQLGLLPIRKAC
ncbi:MAG: metalloregulator ArsR/SmtB family transcription factor [Pseudomonadota bacterium]